MGAVDVFHKQYIPYYLCAKSYLYKYSGECGNYAAGCPNNSAI